jgi:hypothetical protein
MVSAKYQFVPGCSYMWNSTLDIKVQPENHLYTKYIYVLRGNRFTVCTEITIILGTVRFTIRGGRLRYKRYDAHFLKKSCVELPFSSFGDHLITILRKVNRLIYLRF